MATDRPPDAMRLPGPIGFQAQVVMSVTLAMEYGTVEVAELDRVPPPEFVHLANARKTPDLVRALPVFHTDGVFRNYQRVTAIDRMRDVPSADDDGITLDLYLVQVAAIL